jgi:hypothetical protein
MSIVVSASEREWKKDDGTVTKVTDVRFDDGREVPGYDLPADKLVVGQPLPEGWSVEMSARGKPYIKVPKERKGGGFGGGAAAFRNTKEGQAIEQERMDRRTALMQAVANSGPDMPNYVPNVLKYADEFYAWLRRSANLPASSATGAGTPHTPAPTSSAVSTVAPERQPGTQEGLRAAAEDRGQGSEAFGEGVTGPCSHQDTSPLRPDGNGLPAGMLRCLACGQISTKQGVFR